MWFQWNMNIVAVECNTPGQVIWQGASTCVVLHLDRTDC